MTIVAGVTRECLGAIADLSIFSRRVARELSRIVERRGKPGVIVSVDGGELASYANLA